MNSTVQHRIREIVCEQLGVDAAELLPEASILDDLGADSLDVVELVMALEEQFDISVPEDELEGVLTVGQAVSLVSDKLSARA